MEGPEQQSPAVDVVPVEAPVPSPAAETPAAQGPEVEGPSPVERGGDPAATVSPQPSEGQAHAPTSAGDQAPAADHSPAVEPAPSGDDTPSSGSEPAASGGGASVQQGDTQDEEGSVGADAPPPPAPEGAAPHAHTPAAYGPAGSAPTTLGAAAGDVTENAPPPDAYPAGDGISGSSGGGGGGLGGGASPATADEVDTRCLQNYTVALGDTCELIGAVFDLSFKQIMALNKG